MENETSAVNDFLGEVTQENQEFIRDNNVFDVEEPIIEDKQEEVTEPEKNVPFHKDPKLQKFIEKEIKKRLETTQEVVKPQQINESDDDFFARLIGNDTPEKVAMIREYKAREQKLLEQAEERAFNRIASQREQEIEAERQAEDQLMNAIDEIEENYNVDLTSKDPVARKMRVDFLTFVEKIAPKDGNGNIVDYPDMTSAFETFQEMRKASTTSTNRAKTIASRSMARSGETVAKPEERVTFDNVDNFISKLFNK